MDVIPVVKPKKNRKDKWDYDKELYKNEKMLSDLKFFKLKHDELPDVIAYSKDQNLLFLCKAVHSTCPMSELRVHKLKLFCGDYIFNCFSYQKRFS